MPKAYKYNLKYYSTERGKKALKRARERARFKKYGITQEQWDKLFLSQGNGCAICKTTKSRYWHTDHCHSKNYVRGILCDNCNLGLGQFKDNSIKLSEASEYLYKTRIKARDFAAILYELL